MQENGTIQVDSGGFSGCLMPGFAGVQNDEVLHGLSGRLERATSGILGDGRNRVVVLPFSSERGEVDLAVKSFGQQSGLKDRYDQRHGSKAFRTFRAAQFLGEHQVGTPEPIGYVERWEGTSLAESYYLSGYEGGLTSFKDELVRIYRKEPDCESLMDLLQFVATGIRKMHDAGFWHRDLGNQNIMMRRADGGGWTDFQVIDLNRGRIRDEVSMHERGFDLSRIALPTDFLRIFFEMYWERVPPPEFVSAERRFRKRFAFHTATRKWRHPIRSRRQKDESESQDDYPSMEDIWIWDEKSAQAMITMQRDERKRYYPKGRNWSIAKSTMKALGDVRREYKALLPQAFSEPVILTDRIGVALDPGLDIDKQLALLSRLGRIPVFIRFYHHESSVEWTRACELVRHLHAHEHRVAIALVQDRRAVLDPDSWRSFMETVLGEVGDCVELAEVCHAVNRVKWGVWSTDEHRQLLEPVVDLQLQYPKIRFSGPSCIDFEYQYIVASLDQMPEALQFGAVSHHLYVDRRGAPENRQGRFSLVEKCALLRAVARWSHQCDDRVVVSEVNWPVEGTGIWSPVGAPYESPGPRYGDPSVPEDRYGAYMLRYLMLALCSGFVHQVYWWRLVAHGFGLVDERAEDGWRERPAFRMLEVFLKKLGHATFVRRLESVEDTYAMLFETDEGSVVVAWSNQGEFFGPWSFEYDSVMDAFGEQHYEVGELVPVDHAPVYFDVTDVL